MTLSCCVAWLSLVMQSKVSRQNFRQNLSPKKGPSLTSRNILVEKQKWKKDSVASFSQKKVYNFLVLRFIFISCVYFVVFTTCFIFFRMSILFSKFYILNILTRNKDETWREITMLKYKRKLIQIIGNATIFSTKSMHFLFNFDFFIAIQFSTNT